MSENSHFSLFVQEDMFHFLKLHLFYFQGGAFYSFGIC